MEKISKQVAQHHSWDDHCDGWHLLKTDTLSVIQKRIPPNTTESLHFLVISEPQPHGDRTNLAGWSTDISLTIDVKEI